MEMIFALKGWGSKDVRYAAERLISVCEELEARSKAERDQVIALEVEARKARREGGPADPLVN
jgi:hypothetical protein